MKTIHKGMIEGNEQYRRKGVINQMLMLALHQFGMTQTIIADPAEKHIQTSAIIESMSRLSTVTFYEKQFSFHYQQPLINESFL